MFNILLNETVQPLPLDLEAFRFKPTRLTLRITLIAISPNGTTIHFGDIGLLLRKKMGILKL